jgi:hypothetical protein
MVVVVVELVLGVGVPNADADVDEPPEPFATTETPYGVVALRPLNVHDVVFDVMVNVEGSRNPNIKVHV